MMSPTDQRRCAKCGKDNYISTSRWCFVGGVQCLCSACALKGWTFDEYGNVVIGMAPVLRAVEREQQPQQEQRYGDFWR